MEMAQADLFSAPTLPGLAYGEGLISAAEEAALITHIDGSELAPFRFHGWLGKRLAASFGWRYGFDNARFGPTIAIPD